jgi:predicted HicB family RNase H-like nuclease
MAIKSAERVYLSIQIPRRLHRELKVRAAGGEVSLEKFVTGILEAAVLTTSQESV